MSEPLPTPRRPAAPAGSARQPRPRFRGVIHQWSFFVALVAGVGLVAWAPAGRATAACAVYAAALAGLLGTSALYHRVTWRRPGVRAWVRRLDHSMIFVLIAGSYTPFSLMLLSTEHAVVLLSVVWGGALLGVLFRVFWLGAPRWMYVPLYLLLGWAAVFYFPEFAREAPTAVMVLLIVGGGLYTLGALVYGFKKPDPWPTWYGFHEVFHTLTIAAFVVHYIGVSILAYTR
jgi:hemolysin III